MSRPMAYAHTEPAPVPLRPVRLSTPAPRQSLTEAWRDLRQRVGLVAQEPPEEARPEWAGEREGT